MTPRIDAHHHVWDLAARPQPWMSGDENAPLRRSFDITEFEAVARRAGIDGSVVVQTVGDIVETEELLDLADRSSILLGVVGWVDVAAPDVGDVLDRLLDRPSGRWLKGIRSLVQYEPGPEWLLHPSVVAGLRTVASRGLCNELLVKPHQLRAVEAVVGAIPESRFVIDHLAKPPVATGDLDAWAAALAPVGAHENVVAKISGLVTEAVWSTWSSSDIRPFADRAIALFGARRLVFGTDWPVCTLAASYDRVVGLAAELLDGLADDERCAVFGGNAAAVYGLTAPEEP